MPIYDLLCLGTCGRAWERLSTVAARHDVCEVCGGAVQPMFTHSVQHNPFIPYFDIGLGLQIDSMPERRRAMRNLKMDYRDKMSAGDLSARRDRVEAQRQEARRG